MKLELSGNISRLRKEHSMTQEQLAEALGVSFASVSKWERGAATPELGLIAEMADLFGVSLDALIGYEFRNNDRESVLARLKQLLHDRSGEDASEEIEKALRRYPNCFEVVYRSAKLYQSRGLCQRNTEYSKRAMELYRHACRLIAQNTDPEISEISIRQEIAQLHLALGEYEKGLEILKKNDPCRLNYPLIGYTLASSCNDLTGALPYLSMALLDLTVSHTDIVMGYLNIYCKSKDYANALAVVDWALAFSAGLKTPGKRNYLDKTDAIFWANRANLLFLMGRTEEAWESLRQAKTTAWQFDEAPDYSTSAVRFVSDEIPGSSIDDLGDTAMIGADHMIDELDNIELRDAWRKIKDEA